MKTFVVIGLGRFGTAVAAPKARPALPVPGTPRI